MASRLRVARLERASFVAAGADAAVLEKHAQIVALVRRHLPPVTASLFAEPRASLDGRTLEWYSDLAGQPVSLAALPPAEQARIRAVLDDRLRSLQALADRLPALESDLPASLVSALCQALSYPSLENVYVLGGQPVLTFWGHRSVDAPPLGPPAPPAPPAAPAAVTEAAVGGPGAAVPSPADAPPRAARRLRWLLLALLLALLSAFALLYAMRRCRPPEVVPATPEQTHDPDAGLDEARALGAALEGELRELRRRIEAQLAECPVESIPTLPPSSPAASPAPTRPPPSPEPEPLAPAQAKPALPPCPGERPPEDAPDMAIVFDASGSMRIPADIPRDQIERFAACERSPAPTPECLVLVARLMAAGGSNTRMEVAKRSVEQVVRSLPQDVDIGLAIVADCPHASDQGLFGAGQRPRLLQIVKGLTPMRGTPLGHGIALGGDKVDGVRAEALMLVVSDGVDSCGADPCAVARQLKARKPKLKINVVDIAGNGATDCIAQVTGGRVLSTNSGMPIDRLIREAASDVQKPTHCE
jgi:hypothetical protein